MLLKKISPDWHPSENPGLKVGETIDIGDYLKLVEDGTAVMIGKFGEELPMPGTIFNCPICFKPLRSIEAFTAHVELSHNPKRVLPKPATDKEIVAKNDSFGEKMAKARKAARAKREAEKNG